MKTNEKLEMRINEIKNSIDEAIKYNHVDNIEHLKVTEWIVYGPYKRSECYKVRSKFVKGSILGKNFKTFTLVEEEETKYYLIDCNMEEGQDLLIHLKEKRSLYYSLKKLSEIKKDK